MEKHISDTQLKMLTRINIGYTFHLYAYQTETLTYPDNERNIQGCPMTGYD